MDRELKSFTLKAMSQAGEGEAVIVTKHVLDYGGDLFEDGAVGRQEIHILRGHDWSQGISLGKGKTFETQATVNVAFKLNVALPEGEALRQYLLFDLQEGEQSLAEWSIGFKVYEGGARHETINGRSVRIFQRLSDGSPGLWLREVSVVMAGQVPGTGTLSMKARQDEFDVSAMRAMRDEEDQQDLVRLRYMVTVQREEIDILKGLLAGKYAADQRDQEQLWDIYAKLMRPVLPRR